GDNTFYALIRFVAETKKPLIISTGFANEATIDRLVSLVSNSRKQLGLENNFALLHTWRVKTNGMP
ncbi:MAG: N-acetylneuraminate synthase family protein, partial [Pedosphaera sp.]|nr:N-acetylneuraminate synthase family protein [Pedosphaera sp.]